MTRTMTMMTMVVGNNDDDDLRLFLFPQHLVPCSFDRLDHVRGVGVHLVDDGVGYSDKPLGKPVPIGRPAGREVRR